MGITISKKCFIACLFVLIHLFIFLICRVIPIYTIIVYTIIKTKPYLSNLLPPGSFFYSVYFNKVIRKWFNKMMIPF